MTPTAISSTRVPAGPPTYNYGAEGQMTSTAGLTFTYDGDGRRVSKSGYRHYWFGAGDSPLAETYIGGIDKREYIFFAGRRVAHVDLAISGNNCQPECARYYYLADHLGSTSVLASTLWNNTQHEADYYPFGGERVVTSSSIDPKYRFTGKERDPESGLDNFGARYSSPALGRFVTADSVSYSNRKDPQSWNLYTFTLNNPVTFKDANGHEIVCANNREQCKKDAAAATGNTEAAKRVTTNTVTTQHSFLWFKWTTEKTTIAITGDSKSFSALSSNAAKLAGLVNDKRTITVSYGEYATPSFFLGGIKLNGGSFAALPSRGYDPQGFIDPNRTGATYDPDAVKQGIPQANTAEEFGHEVLGHKWGELLGGHPGGTRANMRDSIAGENAVRALDPTRGQKALESHHDYNEAAPDPPK